MGAPRSTEDIKRASARLRGELVESLADAATGALREDDRTLIKFHGSYQQDDRDVRDARRIARLEPAYGFMIRMRLPGGMVTPRQWLQLDTVAGTFAERGLRITTRQALQLHGVQKRDLRATMRAINGAMIDTIAACGDVSRNVVVSANPLQSRLHAAVRAEAVRLSDHFLPRTRAYYEIWLGEERGAASGSEDEPIYGETYLPRKFKIGFAVPPTNDIDVFAQDLGFIAIVEDGELAGYNVAAGGGMGVTHGDPATYPRLASMLGFVPRDAVTAVAEAVVTTQRDFGDRADRKHARLKYTIDVRGLPWFRAEVERRAGVAFPPSRPFEFAHNGDRFGWIEGEDGLHHLTLHVAAGRVWDRDGLRLQSGLRRVADALVRDEAAGAHFRLTANQNLIVAAVPASLRTTLDALVAEYDLDTGRHSSALRRDALACVALPTCGLAMAEAERYLPQIVGVLERLLERHGLIDAPIHLRVSGCPNGCSRPYLGEIALIGRAVGRYNVMLGADHRGQRLGVLYRENVAEEQIVEALDPLLAAYARERMADERFGDFLVRRELVNATAGPVPVSPVPASNPTVEAT